MTTATPDIDLAALIADTEGEIVRLVQDRDPSTHGLYEMVRYHLALDGSGASGGKRMRPLLGLLAYASITGDHQRALPGAAAVELGHNFSLVHDDIEDGDVERRHRPTLWTIHGVPQAINTGDTMFSLSRIALHRLTDLGFPDSTVLRLMRLFDETCLALCEGQYIDIAMSALGRAHQRRSLLRHDRAQDGGPHRRLDRGRRAAGHRPTRRSSPATARFGWALGLAFQLNDDLLGIWGPEQTTGKEPSDVVHHKKTLPVIYAAEHAGPEDRERLATLRAGSRPDRGRGRRDHRDPRALRRPRVHPRPGPPLPRRGARRARCGRRRQARGPRPPRGDHRRRHQRLTVGVISA